MTRPTTSAIALLTVLVGCYESVPVDFEDREDAFREPTDAGPPDAGLVVEDPDAQWFVYRRFQLRTGGDRGVYAFRLGDSRLVSLGTSRRDGPLWWSPTQAGLYVRQVADADGNMLRIDQLQPDRVDELDFFPGSVSEEVSEWSPDGRFFLYWASGGAVREALGRRRYSVDNDRGWIADKPWVEIIEYTDDGPIVSVATAGSYFEERLLPPLEAGRHRDPAWAPGTGYWAELVSLEPERFVLWMGAGPFATPQRLGEYAEASATGWSRSGEYLLGGGTVWRRDGETVRPLVEAPEGEPIEELHEDRAAAGWLPGNRLVRMRGDEVVLFELRGDAFEETVVASGTADCAVRFTDREPLHLEVRCQRRGPIRRNHVWSEARGAVEVHALEDVDDLNEQVVFWAPSGERAVVLLDGSLYELPTPDAELRLVAEPVQWVEWSPDSSVYVYSEGRSGVAVVDAETGEETPIEPVSDEYLVRRVGFQ